MWLKLLKKLVNKYLTAEEKKYLKQKVKSEVEKELRKRLKEMF